MLHFSKNESFNYYKIPNLCKPFNVTSPAKKEHLADVGFTIWIFDLSGFNTELDCVIFFWLETEAEFFFLNQVLANWITRK